MLQLIGIPVSPAAALARGRIGKSGGKLSHGAGRRKCPPAASIASRPAAAWAAFSALRPGSGDRC